MGCLRTYLAPPRPRLRLVCFPHAGGVATMYRDWAGLVPAETELVAVQYPGRQDRIGEPPSDDITALVDEIAEVLPTSLPLAYFGHSMGATVAFEVARRVRPAHLFVSAAKAPAPGPAERLAGPTEEDLLAKVSQLGGSGAALLANPEIRRLALPPLRHDVTLLEAYQYRPGAPLDCPITALGGEDDVLYPAAELKSWAAHTVVGFDLWTFRGGHFYTEDVPGQVLAVVAEKVGFADDFPPHLRAHAVRILRDTGKSVRRVAWELGVDERQLARWAESGALE